MRAFSYLLLIAIVAGSLPCRAESFATDATKQLPSDQPAEETKDGEELCGESEIKQAVAVEYCGFLVEQAEWNVRSWGNLELETRLPESVTAHSPPLCRAPPIALS